MKAGWAGGLISFFWHMVGVKYKDEISTGFTRNKRFELDIENEIDEGSKA